MPNPVVGGGWAAMDAAAWRNYAHSVEAQRDEWKQQANDDLAEGDKARAEVARIRRDIRAVVREWKDYPASYPRSAFSADVLSALRGD